jgi:uncharacterized membrane protein HdeD (DUF308 family)
MDWRALVIRGVAALLFGILALAWPGITLTALVLLYGAYALVDGAGALAAVLAQAPEAEGRRGPMAALGIVSIGAGIVTFVWPGITALVLLYVIAAWAVVTGAIEIAAAIHLRRVIEGEWRLAVAGVLSVLFGLVLVVAPVAGALAITWLIGVYAVAFGALTIAAGLELRRAERRLAGQARHTRPVSA